KRAQMGTETSEVAHQDPCAAPKIHGEPDKSIEKLDYAEHQAEPLLVRRESHSAARAHGAAATADQHDCEQHGANDAECHRAAQPDRIDRAGHEAWALPVGAQSHSEPWAVLNQFPGD